MLNAFYLKDLIATNDLNTLKQVIDTECMDLSIKQQGGNSLLTRRKEAAKYIKKVDTYRQALRRDWREVYQDGQTYQCMCNGITGIALNSAGNIPNIPNALNGDTFAGENFKMHNVIDVNRIDRMQEIEIDIPAIIERQKSKIEDNKGIKNIDIGIRLFNAEMLLPVIKILSGKITAYAEDDNVNGPMYLKSENGYAIALPLRKKC